jgi:hypothetical protein
VTETTTTAAGPDDAAASQGAIDAEIAAIATAYDAAGTE